tara:strand:+ start:821 stop:1045 length:225 start_codon:yes stop_codon:yes gene_type:complete
MNKPDFYQVVADMMIKQYRVPGNINVPMLTECKVLNVIREIINDMDMNGEDYTHMFEILNRVTMKRCSELFYGN